MVSPRHIEWLLDTGKILTTQEGQKISIFEYSHQKDEDSLSAWAKHFREHYCQESEIDKLREGTGLTRVEYLNEIKFPDKSSPPGPSTRAGDFSEILVADYLEFILNLWVPRLKYNRKTRKNESTMGCDVVGFKLSDNHQEDTLVICEVKARFRTRSQEPRLQDAVKDFSDKYHIKKAESLNALKQIYLDNHSIVEAKNIERFQNINDYPYIEKLGAIAMFDTDLLDEDIETQTSVPSSLSSIPFLMIIHGKDMMNLVHDLYERAANEA